MYLIKILSLEHRNNAVKFGNVRLGTINYYREIEDAKRQDAEEGLGHIIWKGEELSGEDHNRIFTPFENVQMNPEWTIKNKGIPIHGSYPNFNAYCFCYSSINNINEIQKISGGKAKHYYFISDLAKFIAKITEALRPIVEEAIRKYEPDRAESIIRNLSVQDVTYKIYYSDDSKARIVTEENLANFDPKAFHSQDFFQKRTSFSYEQEVRTVWIFVYRHSNGRLEPVQFPLSDEKYQDLVLGKLPISKKRKRNRYAIKTSYPKQNTA